MADEILYQTDGQIVVITLNRADKRNALNAAMREGLWKAWQDFENDDALRVAILTGAGDKAFCAGIDLIEFAETKLSVPPPNFLPVIGQNVKVRKPVIAAVNGFAYAGGWRLVQMCDICVASETAQFAITEARVGRGVPWAAPLVHVIPPRVMSELLMTGNPISARRAYEIGFVNHVVAPDQLMDKARMLANDILAGAPLFIEATKEMIAMAAEVGASDAIGNADRIFEKVYRSEDAAEGPLAFREKRKPNWRGR